MTRSPSAAPFAVARHDLRFPYRWSAAADPLSGGQADDTVLDRAEGDQVLRLINRILATHVWAHPPGLAEALKLERMIQLYLPPHVRTRAEIHDWIVRNWDIV